MLSRDKRMADQDEFDSLRRSQAKYHSIEYVLDQFNANSVKTRIGSNRRLALKRRGQVLRAIGISFRRPPH